MSNRIEEELSDDQIKDIDVKLNEAEQKVQSLKDQPFKLE